MAHVCHRAHPKGVLRDPGQPVALHILVIRPPHRFSVCSVPLAEPAVLRSRAMGESSELSLRELNSSLASGSPYPYCLSSSGHFRT